MAGTNPFGDPTDDSNGEILEGFLCPICREDLKSIEFLTDHFENSHSEEQDALKSIFKDIFSKAKKKILLNFDDGSFDSTRSSDRQQTSSEAAPISTEPMTSSSNARTRTNVFNFMNRQTVGAERGHLEYFQSVRNPRLERYGSETNKLIIRLHKLLEDMPTDPLLRKQHEQKIVTWLDGSSVKLCPNCARSFHIARRQHHCRLCGGIMCHDCSKFLPICNAMNLASLSTASRNDQGHVDTEPTSNITQNKTIRLCHHCLRLLETRQDVHESRTCNPLITQIYAEIKQLHKDISPDLEMYSKIVNSLYDGESIFTIADASALRGKIGQTAEAIDNRSKRIFAIPSEQGSRQEALKKAIRLSCIQTIKEEMLSLPPLPAEDYILQIQERKRMETKQRIETEQRLAMEAFERYGLGPSKSHVHASSDEANFVHGSDLHSINNWSAHQVSASSVVGVTHDDPLVEQINIIKGYIKQARQEMNFEVVETLEINLRELQREFYERQRVLANSTAAAESDKR